MFFLSSFRWLKQALILPLVVDRPVFIFLLNHYLQCTNRAQQYRIKEKKQTKGILMKISQLGAFAPVFSRFMTRTTEMQLRSYDCYVTTPVHFFFFLKILNAPLVSAQRVSLWSTVRWVSAQFTRKNNPATTTLNQCHV